MTDFKKEINIAYIGGGSMNFGWKFISELALDEHITGTVRLYDVDKQLSLANEVIGNRVRENLNKKDGFIYLAVDTLSEALSGADFVILSITQGNIEEITADFSRAEMYGIYQTAGDTVGPVGIMNSIRTIPQYVIFANAIKQHCPNAFVINLTNPMNVCLKTLYKVFPEIKAFGSSNEIFSTQELISVFAAKEKGLSHVNRREIKTNVIGIDGLCWFNEATYNGDNLFELYDKYARRYADVGFEKNLNSYKSNLKNCAHKVKFDLFMRYGLIAAGSDRVLAEYCPPWYLKNPKVASNWKFGIASTSYIKKLRQERVNWSKKLMSGDEQLKVGSSGTDVINLIKAILGYGNIIANVILPNSGQVTNLPDTAMVQTNALISNNTVKPVLAGELPTAILGITLNHISNQELIVEAIFKKDLDIAFNAFLNDPLMTTDLVSATELFKDMLTNNCAYLMDYLED